MTTAKQSCELLLKVRPPEVVSCVALILRTDHRFYLGLQQAGSIRAEARVLTVSSGEHHCGLHGAVIAHGREEARPFLQHRA